MKAARFEYMRAGDTNEALRLLEQNDGRARLIAGAQSLAPMLNLRLARPQLLIDVARIESLRRIEDLGTKWRIGAAVTHAQLEDRALDGAAMLREVAGSIAYRAIRNRGTIGGSLAHADPAADWPVALAALGAIVNLRSSRGLRGISAESFVIGAFTTALAGDEIIESVEVPKLSPAGRHAYCKFSRKTGDFAEASAAAVFDPRARTARLFLGALRSKPMALANLANRVAAEGQDAATHENVMAALAAAGPELDAIERRMASGVIRRALREALQS
jgi:aerobic carbon-monoxide dehydrogenase medium subunit